jgi:hypothetical protein
MEWQPIETAPKDGTCCILLVNGMAIEGCWEEQDVWVPSQEKWVKRGVWSVVSLPSHGCDCCSSDNEAPTHWVPLPQAAT